MGLEAGGLAADLGGLASAVGGGKGARGQGHGADGSLLALARTSNVTGPPKDGCEAEGTDGRGPSACPSTTSNLPCQQAVKSEGLPNDATAATAAAAAASHTHAPCWT